MSAAAARLAQAFASAPVLLALAALFWAGNAIAGRLALGEISPMVIVTVRWLLVFAVLWPIYGGEVRASWSEVRGRLWWVVAMASLGFTIFNALFYVAAYTTTAINLGIIQGAIPVFVMLGALIAYGTKVRGIQVVGVLLTLIGVAVVATKGAPHLVMSLGFTVGDIEILLGCICYAAYAVGLRNRPKMGGAAFFTLLALMAFLTSLPLLVYEIATEGLQYPTPKGWLIALYVAVFPSCLAQLFFMRGVDVIGPGRAGVYINLVPVFSAVLAVAILAEPFALYHAAALVLVIAGIWLAQRAAAPAG